MGLFGLFRKREEKPEPELPSLEVKLSGLSEWLGQELSEKSRSARKRSEELQEKIAGGFHQVRDSAKRLKGVEFEAKDNTYAAVNSVKNTFASRVQSLSEKCPEPILDSYSGMAGFHKRAGELLRELMNMSPRQGMVLTNYFRKESSPVMKGVKSINTLMEELQRFLDYEGKSLFLLEGAGGISREISEGLESARGLEKRGKEIGREIQDLKGTLSKREKNLEGIMKDPGWKGLEEAKREIKALEKRAQDLKFRIGEELSSAKRPLKKFLHLKSGELSREERIFLERFVKSPLKTIMGGSGLEQLRPLLLSLNEMVGRQISLKDKEVQKLDSLIGIMESGGISKSIQDYENILREAGEKENSIEKDFSGLSESKNQAESSIQETREGITRLERELRETQDNAKTLKEGVDKKREELEKLIYENINRKVNIVLDNGAIG